MNKQICELPVCYLALWMFPHYEIEQLSSAASFTFLEKMEEKKIEENSLSSSWTHSDYIKFHRYNIKVPLFNPGRNC